MLSYNTLITCIILAKTYNEICAGGGGVTELIERTLGRNSSVARRLLRVRFHRQLNGFTLVCMSSFAASCGGQTFDDEKGWKVAVVTASKCRIYCFDLT